MPWVGYTDPSEKVLEAEDDFELERRTRRKERSRVFLSYGVPNPQKVEELGYQGAGQGQQRKTNGDCSISISPGALPILSQSLSQSAAGATGTAHFWSD